MYPERIPAEVVIENSDLANKEGIVQRMEAAGRIQNPESGSQKSGKEKRKNRLVPSVDYVNTLTRPRGSVGR